METAIAMAIGAALALGILVAITLFQKRRERRAATDFMSRPEHWGQQ